MLKLTDLRTDDIKMQEMIFSEDIKKYIATLTEDRNVWGGGDFVQVIPHQIIGFKNGHWDYFYTSEVFSGEELKKQQELENELKELIRSLYVKDYWTIFNHNDEIILVFKSLNALKSRITISFMSELYSKSTIVGPDGKRYSAQFELVLKEV